ncbi:carbohydrate porin [Nitrospirillum sp. BR 11828]|uniref:carbohydrate porin n=1 Tax=Nitrospirillum sp. BR 11828 TaxID=3104325 RepID=UPI002ACA9B11|nr:carbohydrate porin [Nitrospirillum sp. BR 11828]MDZ5647904.1 carbohydrate porin [Nitrospirillum sp. BR 11828]
MKTLLTITPILAFSCGVAFCGPVNAADADLPEAESWSLHGQFTLVEQYHPSFTSPYRGANSLDPGARGNETMDATLYAGVRLWPGMEFYANPEIDQGFGLSNTLGVAGFPSAEAYKVGESEPYIRLDRAFFRQTFNLGGEVQPLEAAANQLGGSRTADNIVITAGKFSVTDIFDANTYAHDPRKDFLNWTVVDSGAFDYAADAWGYSYGAAAEWTQSWWTLRAGLFDLSRKPNDKALVRGFGQYEVVVEAEERHQLMGRDGKVKVLIFQNHANMGSYSDALQVAALTGGTPDTGTVRRYATRAGFALNAEQQMGDDWGLFLRASANDGSKEAYEFTDVNKSVSIGASVTGASWGRDKDAAGLAGVVNMLNADARDYLAAGGTGILVGDGRLSYSSERILEAYYSAALWTGINLTLDYQFVANPAYNRDRGPANVLGVRFHAEI